jgi:hypothetical protein
MSWPGIIALAAYQVHVGLRPGIQSTLRTGELCLAGFLPSGSLGWRYRLPVELKTCSSQFCIRTRVAAAGDNIMAHPLPGFLPSRLASV